MNCLKCYDGLGLWFFYSPQAGDVGTEFCLLRLQFVGHLQRLFCQIDIHQCLFIVRNNGLFIYLSQQRFLLRKRFIGSFWFY